MPGMTGLAGRKSSSGVITLVLPASEVRSPPPTPSTGRHTRRQCQPGADRLLSGAATGHRLRQASGRTDGSGRLNPALLACGCHIVQRNQCLQLMLQDWQVLLGKTAQLRVRAGLRFGLV